jgi:1-phosphofructokinase
MIVTLTVNPSVDRTIAVAELVRGGVNRATSSRVDPGGKGINVSRALAGSGVATRAVVAIGGAQGRRLAALLAQVRVDVVAVPIRHPIRSNVTVVEPDGTTTKLNEPGARLTPQEVTRLLAAVRSAAAGADWLVAGGSLPPGVPATFYGDLARAVGGQARVAVDTSGPALALALPGRPALVKPNADELAEYAGEHPRTLADVVAACRRMRADGAAAVLASLGVDGAVLAEGDAVWHARAPSAVPVSSVGAGDALLAGFLAAGGRGPDALVTAVAWGTAAVGLPGSGMPGPADVHREEVILTPAPDLTLAIA